MCSTSLAEIIPTVTRDELREQKKKEEEKKKTTLLDQVSPNLLFVFHVNILELAEFLMCNKNTKSQKKKRIFLFLSDSDDYY